MPEANCVQHFDRKAVGNCSSCGKPFCAECLDVETAHPLCPNCKQLKAREAFKASLSGGAGAPGTPSLMDDDPLGLFTGKPPAPQTEPAKAAPPSVSPAPGAPPTVAPKPSGRPAPSFKPPAGTPGSVPLHSLNLDNLIQEPKALRPPFPQASYPAPPVTGSSPPPKDALASPMAPFDNFASAPGISALTPGTLEGTVSSKKNPLSFAKMWAKFLSRRTLGLLGPLAKKLKVPTFVLGGVAVLLVAGGVTLAVVQGGQPPLALVDIIQPIHMVQVNSSQISELDITAYSDLQTKIQAMGFQPILQMTIPQLPTTNFFDVYMKEDAGTYAEILKMPGQIAPHLSFVTVFTNGLWFSTNAWQGAGQELKFLVSENFPTDTPDQLYVHHMQTLEKLKNDGDLQPQGMSENRYMSALSDHLRWFLNKKGIPTYQADFSQWH